jgi:beta-lactamase class A
MSSSISSLRSKAVPSSPVSEDKFSAYINDFKPVRRGGEKFKFINPLVGTDSPNSFDVGYKQSIKKEVDALIEEYKKKGLKDYSVYYRELNSSMWFGINEEEEFFPASLLKLSISLAAYKYAEDNPSYLDTKFLFTQEIHDIALERKNEETSLVVGKSYSIRELVDLMLVDSDNSARDLIISTLPDKYHREIYEYLGISEPSPYFNFKISTANYALIFRLLYSSTFINEPHSEELLKVLTKTKFPYALRRDIPSDIPVAHKFGVFNLPEDENGLEMQQLHDCGIVYQLDNPYLICVMTQGKEQAVLADFIAKVSSVVYRHAASGDRF